MTVSDGHVAALRAILVGNFDEYDRLSDQFDQSDGWGDYPVLLQAAFFEAVDRRFGSGHTGHQIIEYVADARSRFEHTGKDINPRVAERLVLAALGDPAAIDDIDGKALGATELFVLAALITDEGLDDAALDDFLKEARSSADEWPTAE